MLSAHRDNKPWIDSSDALRVTVNMRVRSCDILVIEAALTMPVVACAGIW